MRPVFRMFFVFVCMYKIAFSFAPGISEPELDARVHDILAKMTIEEKAGQMTQLTLAVISKPRKWGTFEMTLDSAKLHEAIVKYHIGSVLNTGGMANTVDNWQQIITQIQDVALKETRLGIPVIYGIDAIHGANYTKDATLFPQNIAMAATFNRELIYKSAEVTALELRASGIPWDFNPVLGVGRNPAWPRFWETYGEDPYEVSEMGRVYIKGLQGDDNEMQGTKIAACMKHYLGYSFPINGRDRTPAWIPERILRDIFLPPFKAAVEAGVATVMINSSEINGIPVHSDYHLLTELLRNELGFKGLAVSDWEDIKRLYDRDRVASSPEEAVQMSVMAGVDMSMVPRDFSFTNILLKLVKEGKIPVSRIDEAVSRILRVKIQTGLFENPYPEKTLKSDIGSKQARQINLNCAREAITLIKNTNAILPLDKKTKVLVTGPTANLLSTLNGGWSITWQGGFEKAYPADKMTVMEAIQEKTGTKNVYYSRGSDFNRSIDPDSTLALVKNVDVIILCLGEKTYCESNGNIDDLNLSGAQVNLARELYKTGKPVIIVLLEGRPRVIHEIVDGAQAIIMAYLPGMEGGRAIADVIFGDVNPSGKLPFTYPAGANGFSTYDRKPMEEISKLHYNEQFPFGYGLSYTSFKYSDLTLSKNEINTGDTIEVSVKVKNTGDIAGKETVLLFGTDVYGSISRPVKQLKKFTKIFLKPGEQKRLKFVISPFDFAFTGRDNKLMIEPGLFRISVADQTREFILKE